MNAQDIAFAKAAADQALTKYMRFTKVQGLMYTTLEFAEPSNKNPRSVTYELSVVAHVPTAATRKMINLLDPGLVAAESLLTALHKTIKLALSPHFGYADYILTFKCLDKDVYRHRLRGTIRKLRNIPKETK